MRKTLLILGAHSDIAQATARLYASNDYDLILLLRKSERLKALQAELHKTYGVHIALMDYDVSDTSQVEVFNSLPVPDVVLCAIGHLGTTPLLLNDHSQTRQILDSNFSALVIALNALADLMAKANKGIIIGISSVAGERGRQSNLIYGSAKAGFTAYLSGLRNRLHTAKVHVLTVKPGFVNTKMTANLDLPRNLTATPERVARAIYRGSQRKHNTIYVLPVWRLIMFIIRQIPEFIFKRLKL